MTNHKKIKRNIITHRLWFVLLALLPAVSYAEDPVLPQQPSTTVQPSSLPTMALIETQRVPDHLTLEQNQAKIGNIIVTRRNVFNPNKPEEDIFVFRLANAFHVTTRDSVIRRQLLFKPGDVYAHRVLAESERFLRANGYLVDAEIKPVRYDSTKNIVDIEVITQDSWTFTGSISFGREGGTNSFSAEISESNLFGFGKDLGLQFSSDVDRSETSISYKDPLLFGTRNRLALVYSDKSDGAKKYFALDRPFYSLDTRWAGGIAAGTDNQTESLYELGKVYNQFQHYSEIAEAYLGFSRGYINKLVYRWRVGFEKELDEFSRNENYPNDPIPDDRDFRFPYLRFDLYEDQVIKTQRIHLIRRLEDLNLGNEAMIKVGWSDEAFGATNEGLVFESRANMAFKPTVNQLLLFSPEFSGYLSETKAENTKLGFTSRYYLPNIKNQVFYMALSAEYVENPYLDEQVLLGGDSGLRGYPLRYQQGDRKFLFTVEQRFYTSWNLFELANVGGLVFFDVGRAWFPGVEKNPNTDILRDWGIGMRLASTRSSGAVVLHIDLAFPLDGDDSIDNSQLLISTQESF
ncbi:BamA/TamA family outer membrane protein [Kaarinaea lacus]